IHEWYAGFPPIVRHSFDIPYKRSSYSPHRNAAHVFQFPPIPAAWYPIYYPHEALHYAKHHIVSKFSLDLSWAYPADTVLCALLTEYLQLEVHREQYQPGNPMIGLQKTWIQYDAWHNEVLRVDSKWDTTQREWVETEKRERHYDAENRMTAYTEYQRNAAQWEGTLRTTREYIQQDQIISTDFFWANGNW